MSATPQAMLNAVVAEFERRGWRDVDDAALRIVRSVEDSGGVVNADSLATIPTPTFLARNGATRAAVREAVTRALDGLSLRLDRPVLIPIDAVDSFKAVASVKTRDIGGAIEAMLSLPEETVKQHIAAIIGEPYLAKDWGGELSDIDTTRVELDGRRVIAAFLLKGRGAPKHLRPTNLGKNGDQIRRLSKQNAELLVVQHVGSIDEAVRDQLLDTVVARRAEGKERVVGSVWDGADCARLFVAYGLVDEDGKPLT